MFIRKLLLLLLGFENYLKLISYIFLKTFTSKLFLGAHYQVRFLNKLVKEGDCCVDIGANLGYFSIPLSGIVGPNGKVLAVEPVAAFRDVLKKNISNFTNDNVEVLPFALGEEDGKKIKMGTPMVNGVVRHGRTEVLETENENTAKVHEAIMRSPESLFGDLEKVNFIKCDVEGYELHIIPHLLGVIEKFRPTLEIEIDPVENKREIIKLILPLSYKVFVLNKGSLEPYDTENLSQRDQIELYFIPEEKVKNLDIQSST